MTSVLFWCVSQPPSVPNPDASVGHLDTFSFFFFPLPLCCRSPFYSLPCILTAFSCVSTSCMSSSMRKKASSSTRGRGVRQGCLCQRFVSYYCWISDRLSGPVALAYFSHTPTWWLGGLWNSIRIVRFVWLDWVRSLTLEPFTPSLKGLISFSGPLSGAGTLEHWLLLLTVWVFFMHIRVRMLELSINYEAEGLS